MHSFKGLVTRCVYAIVIILIAAHAAAADYSHGVAESGSASTLWFKSSVNTTWVDAHYRINEGGQQNVRMNYSAANARYEQALGNLSVGTRISYWFTYNNGNPAYDTPSFTYTVGGGDTGGGGPVDLGPHVKVFDPSTPATTIQAAVDAAFNAQLLSPTAQFGAQRHVFLFKPGRYSVWVNTGFYTTVAGLGRNPDDVTLNGAVNVDSGWNYGDQANATQNFWRSVENLAIQPNGGTNRWAVSQAAPMRRVHIRGNLVMNPSNSGWSSGGYIADSKIDGVVATGSQQQWYTRDSNVGNWYDGVWNTVFSGVVGAPAQSFPSPPYTTLANTPISRDKPYLYLDAAGNYTVFVPTHRVNAVGASWANGATPGYSLPLSQFHIARPGDSAASINAALAAGKHLFFTPGIYTLNDTLRVTRANTVVLGIGFPTLIPQGGVNAMSVADVDGVRIAGLVFDAGTVNSAVLLTVGVQGAGASHAANPISVQDVYFRIGGALAGKATTSLIVNANDTLLDHIWAWRADHGNVPTGWDINPGDTGLIVNGHNVLATGLFVEHYREYEVIWNGENGRTIFFQNEMPYDVPNQASWTSGRGNGWAAYKVADHVKTHEGWGMGSYCFFNIGGQNTQINAARGFEVPVTPGVRLHHVFTVSLGGNGTISRVVNDSGAITGSGTTPSNLISYP